ncbi:universal stress protein [uncultured Nocardioides sp.]|uniref:universal stress protein n=1 Tax=uncultured Nocardioides sp. TaxID=198441 RepID=UPI0026060E09|nr:universal stress protein [uncultured Nocardioides sp.]
MTGPLDLDDLRGSVVVAVDGSEHAQRALRWAADEAAFERRSLAVVAVGDAAGAAMADAVAAVTRLHPELPVTCHVARGDPRQVLIDASELAFVLVLGSRGRGPVRSMLLGSVSAAVSRQAACPVVVCRPAEPGTRRGGVVVGADGSPESLPVIEFAYRHAFLRGAPLTVLHSFFDAAAAVAQYHEARGEPAEMPALDDLRAELGASVAGLEKDYPGVPVTLTLRHGLVDQALAPRHAPWDLVVVGRHPMRSLGRLLTGSIATAVLERATCPVAVVPESLARRDPSEEDEGPASR